MRRKDRIKLDFTRNWNLPGKERLSSWMKPSKGSNSTFNNGITWLRNEDIAIFTTADNYIEWAILSNGTYEEEINKLIRVSLKRGQNALDIGGNIGLQTIRMSQCVGEKGRVLAVEPMMHLKQKLLNNLSLNKVNNVTVLPFALADNESNAQFPVNKDAWNQGTFSLSDSGTGSDSQFVEVKIGDQVAEIQQLQSLELIKIDVEGFEHQVIKGLFKTIQKHRPRIIFEYDRNYWLKTAQSVTDCFQSLNSLGYDLYQITSVGCELITNPNAIVGGNLFCLPAKL